MSVLIKGMKMPHSCSDCDYAHVSMFYHCIQNNIGHRDCAYVELPEKHGRLVDADALIREHFSHEHRIALSEANKAWMRKIINDAPTIVESEGE